MRTIFQRTSAAVSKDEVGYDLKQTLLAGLIYALMTFAVGFLFGTVRVLFLAPRVGELLAVIAEFPLIIFASYLLARWTIRKTRIPPRPSPRIIMGIAAFATLMVCEIVTSIWLFGNSFAQHLAHYSQPHAWIGVAGQLLFAAIPVLLLKTRKT